jgi:hypothetical protein
MSMVISQRKVRANSLRKADVVVEYGGSPEVRSWSCVVTLKPWDGRIRGSLMYWYHAL